MPLPVAVAMAMWLSFNNRVAIAMASFAASIVIFELHHYVNYIYAMYVFQLTWTLMTSLI
jgi:hypothetical protein